LDVRVLGSAAPGSPTGDATFTLVPPFRLGPLDGVVFWLSLPGRIAHLLSAFRPDAVVCQTAYEAAAALLARRLARVPAQIVVEVHGDWRTSTRLYGSGSRRALARIGDVVAAAALRRSDAVRTVSPFTTRLVGELGLEATAVFPAYMDLEPFGGLPCPLADEPVALFVGVLEAYKNIDGLAAAWRLAAGRLPHASLRIVGKGSRADIAAALVREHGARWDRELSATDVAQAMNDAWVLVLPSRSEGMGRVLVEAFCRGRGVVGTRAGSIPDLVADGVSGLLVPPDDPAALADALVRVLSDRALAEQLSNGAHTAAAPWLQTPEDYARRMRELVA
jgi:glycosyltransferase involved in cell wall biosynthesis